MNWWEIRVFMQQSSKYTNLIRTGRLNDPYLQKALTEVRRGDYTLPVLKSAVMKGLAVNITEYKEWISKSQQHEFWEKLKERAEKNLADLEAGNETTIYDSTIPAD